MLNTCMAKMNKTGNWAVAYYTLKFRVSVAPLHILSSRRKQ